MIQRFGVLLLTAVVLACAGEQKRAAGPSTHADTADAAGDSMKMMGDSTMARDTATVKR